MLWETGYAIHDEISMKQCNYDASECYTAKSVPAIYSIDQKEGFVTGGQVITVKGFGFGSGTIKPTLDGVACDVLTQKSDEFTCRAGSKDGPSVLVDKVTSKDKDGNVIKDEEGKDVTTEVPKDFVGQQGLSLRKFKEWDWHNTYHWKKREDDPKQFKDLLAMHYEGIDSNDNMYQANIYRGWFTAPETTKYRFHQSCNDYCDLLLGDEPGQSAKVTKVLDINHWSEFRRTSQSEKGGYTRVTEWIPLEKGKKYYTEVEHLNGWGS